MYRKKIFLLSIFLVGLLAISAVSAADNATDDIVSASDDTEIIGVENNNDTLNSDESNVLMADESNDQILQSNVNSTVEVLGASDDSPVKSDEVLGAINPDSAQADPVLKAKKVKTVKMNVKYKWTTKKIGNYKITARLWKVRYAYGYMTYLDIHLYKNGKQLKKSAYLSKYQYKENGRWKWWPNWRHGGTYNPFHRYINCVPIRAFALKFRY